MDVRILSALITKARIPLLKSLIKSLHHHIVLQVTQLVRLSVEVERLITSNGQKVLILMRKWMV